MNCPDLYPMALDDKPLDDRIERLGLAPEDYYFSEEGYLVFTERYHLKRGYCCKSGCRHCPYGYGPSKGANTKGTGTAEL